LHAAVVSRHIDRLRIAGEDRNAIGFDHQIDDKRAPVCRWQLRQWQQCVKSGSSPSR